MPSAFWKRGLLAASALALVSVTGEIAIRLVQWVELAATGNRDLGTITLDERLGWRPSESHHLRGEVEDFGGRKALRTFSTDAQGFRTHGDPESNRPRLLVIGDSLTLAAAVSDDEVYTSRLSRSTGFEVFGIGGGGWGTLQELLALDAQIGRIRPAAVLLQLCSNDFINNSFELESLSRRNNNGMRRPYLFEDGTIRYLLPKRWPAVRQFAWSHSRLLSFLMIQLNRAAAGRGDSIEDEIARGGAAFPPFRRSAAITAELLRRFRQHAGARPVYAFASDHDAPYYATFRELASRAGITFLAGVPEALDTAAARGEITLAADGVHWNARGHEVVARALAAALAAPRP